MVMNSKFVQQHQQTGRPAGERDFRDFFRLSPAQENRAQPEDPASGRPSL